MYMMYVHMSVHALNNSTIIIGEKIGWHYIWRNGVIFYFGGTVAVTNDVTIQYVAILILGSY